MPTGRGRMVLAAILFAFAFANEAGARDNDGCTDATLTVRAITHSRLRGRLSMPTAPRASTAVSPGFSQVRQHESKQQTQQRVPCRGACGAEWGDRSHGQRGSGAPA
jgi:hypothetical protein